MEFQKLTKWQVLKNKDGRSKNLINIGKFKNIYKDMGP